MARTSDDIRRENSDLYERISRDTGTVLWELHQMSPLTMADWLKSRGNGKLSSFVREANRNGDLIQGFTREHERKLRESRQTAEKKADEVGRLCPVKFE